MKDYLHKCLKCALYANEFCQIKKKKIEDPANFACEYYTTELFTCDVCKNKYPTKLNFLLEDGKVCNICENCETGLSMCQTCEEGHTCDFATNPINIPPVIQKQIRQGNMIQIVQVKNPERVKACCTTCKCFVDDQCCKELGCCDKYKLPTDALEELIIVE